jgi:hypothetical protein
MTNVLGLLGNQITVRHQFTFARSSISIVSNVTSAQKRSISIAANGIFVTVVKKEGTFIDIWKYLTKLSQQFS